VQRRSFITLLGGVILAPLAVRAQQKTIPVIGILDARGANPDSDLLSGIRKGLAETGYTDGQNVVVQYRGADGHYDRFAALATEFVRAGVGIIVAPTLPAALAAKAATTTIPVVFMLGDDPLKQGLVASLNKPGGNATGLSMLTAGLDAKRLQLLSEIVPDVERVGLLINPDNRSTETQIHDVQTAGSAMGRDIEIFQARNDQGLEAIFFGFTQSRLKALLVGADPFFNSRRRQHIVDLAREHRIPAIYEWREFADAGGLVSYGSSVTENYRQLGVYAGKILSGAKPADLPVMQPTKFELVINLKTAKELRPHCAAIDPRPSRRGHRVSHADDRFGSI
jgi:putative ABC transport system substrate-binding protein